MTLAPHPEEVDYVALPPLLLEPPWARPYSDGPLREGELAEAREELERCRHQYAQGRYDSVATSAQQLRVRIGHRLKEAANEDVAAEAARIAGSAATLVGRTRRRLKGSWKAVDAFKEAAGFFERARRSDALDPDELTDYGLVLEALERVEEAEPVLREAVTHGAESPDAHRHLAELLFRRGDHDEAAGLVREALERERHDPAANRLLAAILERRGERDEAGEHYERAAFAFARRENYGSAAEALAAARRTGRRSARTLAGHGDLLRVRGMPDEAVAPLRDAVAADPGLSWAYASLAASLYATDRPKDALQALDDALERAPDYALAHAMRGRLLRAEGRTADAVEAFQRALKLEPTLLRTHVELGRALLAEGRRDEAIRTLHAALRRAPDDPVILAAVGEALSTGGERDAAADAIKRAVGLDPHLIGAEATLVAALGDRGKAPQEAVDAANRLVAEEGETATALVSKGRVLAQAARLEEATINLRRALEEEPDDVGVRLDLADILIHLGRSDEALAELDAALEHDRDDPRVPMAKGRLLRVLGRLSEAREALEAARALAPEQIGVHLELARVFWRLCQNPAALEALEPVFAAAPEHPKALAQRAAIRITEDDPNGARIDIEAALQKGATAWRRAIEARTLLALGAHAEAEIAIERSLALLGKEEDEAALADVEALGEVADVLRRLRRDDEALELLDRALEVAPDSAWVLGTKGQTLRPLPGADEDEALDLLHRAVQLEPSLVWAWAELGEAYRMGRRYEEATAAFDEVLKRIPHHRWALGGKGASLHARELYVQAVEALTQVVAQDPTEAFAVTRLAALLLEVGEFERTVAVLDGDAIPEDDAALVGMRAWALENLGPARAEEALAAYEAALRLAPGAVWAHRGAAESLSALGDDDRAGRRFNEAIDIAKKSDQVDANMLTTIGRCYYALRQYADAARIYTEALHGDPTKAEAMMSLGLALMGDGRCGAGMREYERAATFVAHDNPLRRRGVLEVACHDLDIARRRELVRACEEPMREAEALVRAAHAEACREAGEDLARIHALVDGVRPG